jgi:hypothetical protein
MPCLEMKELETVCSKYEERRRVATPPSSERRNAPGRYRAGEARIAYLIQLHRQSCAVCSQAIDQCHLTGEERQIVTAPAR